MEPPAPALAHYRVPPGAPLDLAAIDPADTGPYERKGDAAEELDRQRNRIQELQPRLYAEGTRALLVVLQAMDTGGKDGTIKHVFRGVNPQGCRVWSFKEPSAEELSHDFLWRYHQRVPPRGMMGIFNRSHYEDVLIVRVKELVPEAVWRGRYRAINEWEHALVQGGVAILKFFLHIGRAEQKRRLEARLERPDKRWKFAPSDVRERLRWGDYQAAYADALRNCSTPHAPWYVVPADHKWYRNLVVARVIADTLAAMDPRFPEPPPGLDRVVIPD